MDHNVSKENLCIFNDVLECSVTYELPKDHLPESDSM